MKLNNRIFAAGATLCVAAIAGYFVQSGDRSSGPSSAQVRPASVASASIVLFEPQDITPLAAPSDAAVAAQDGAVSLPGAPVAAREATGFSNETRALAARLATLDQGFRTPGISARNLNPFGLPCELSLNATPAAGAMVHVVLSASCHPAERVEISQDRLRFAATTTNTGTLETDIPALRDTPLIVVQFEDGQLLTASAKVPAASSYERVVLQWQGDNAVHIHAYEFGAGYRDDGHVWARNPRDPAYGDNARGGFLTALGDAGANTRQAEIYSYPLGESRDSSVVRVNIEAEVTKSNCGGEIEAETLQSGVDGTLEPAALIMSVPDCEAVGEFLVLKNILRDLKIARN